MSLSGTSPRRSGAMLRRRLALLPTVWRYADCSSDGDLVVEDVLGSHDQQPQLPVCGPLGAAVRMQVSDSAGAHTVPLGAPQSFV